MSGLTYGTCDFQLLVHKTLQQLQMTRHLVDDAFWTWPNAQHCRTSASNLRSPSVMYDLGT